MISPTRPAASIPTSGVKPWCWHRGQCGSPGIGISLWRRVDPALRHHGRSLINAQTVGLQGGSAISPSLLDVAWCWRVIFRPPPTGACPSTSSRRGVVLVRRPSASPRGVGARPSAFSRRGVVLVRRLSASPRGVGARPSTSSRRGAVLVRRLSASSHWCSSIGYLSTRCGVGVSTFGLSARRVHDAALLPGLLVPPLPSLMRAQRACMRPPHLPPGPRTASAGCRARGRDDSRPRSWPLVPPHLRAHQERRQRPQRPR